MALSQGKAEHARRVFSCEWRTRETMTSSPPMVTQSPLGQSASARTRLRKSRTSTSFPPILPPAPHPRAACYFLAGSTQLISLSDGGGHTEREKQLCCPSVDTGYVTGSIAGQGFLVTHQYLSSVLKMAQRANT